MIHEVTTCISSIDISVQEAAINALGVHLVANPDLLQSVWNSVRQSLASVICEYQRYSPLTIELTLVLVRQLMQTFSRDLVIGLCKETIVGLQSLVTDVNRNLSQ